jgi:type I restriction enzyme M protein
VEALNHLSKQVKTIAHRNILQTQSLIGYEPKPLPYLLAQMNLLLHGLDSPQINPDNALGLKLTEIGEKDRVDVILTNPPFGGEEEKGIQGNFPEDRQTAETALLFLQLIMRRLRRTPSKFGSARAAVVVPNGTLFGDGICARIKEELLKDFNLHTIVRLPNGVFAPYTSIPTNLLFFDRSGPTKEVWYYEHPLPEGRKNYTKTQPLQFEEFKPCLDWWSKREENARVWKWNFREDYESAVAKAKPHWDKAEEERAKAAKLIQQAKQNNAEINDLCTSAPDKVEDKRAKLTALRDATLAEARAAEQTAKEEKSVGDALYWPLYNLDRKNPHGKADLEHLPPERLVSDILAKEHKIMEIMKEIQTLLNS